MNNLLKAIGIVILLAVGIPITNIMILSFIEKATITFNERYISAGLTLTKLEACPVMIFLMIKMIKNSFEQDKKWEKFWNDQEEKLQSLKNSTQKDNNWF